MNRLSLPASHEKQALVLSPFVQCPLAAPALVRQDLCLEPLVWCRPRAQKGSVSLELSLPYKGKPAGPNGPQPGLLAENLTSMGRRGKNVILRERVLFSAG